MLLLPLALPAVAPVVVSPAGLALKAPQAVRLVRWKQLVDLSAGLAVRRHG